MNLRIATVAIAAAGLAAACSDDAPPNGNPAQLWLALDGSEVQVRLVSVKPPEF